jgi:tyrosyl-DNA phosphodiesterase 2
MRADTAPVAVYSQCEDTSINLMRLDSTCKERHVRLDRVLVKGSQWRASRIDLLASEPLLNDLPRVFPLDHFGMMCGVERR